MRTTLELDDAVVLAARAIAREEGISIGAAVSRLARSGLSGGNPRARRDGFPSFTAPEDATPITLAVVNEFRDDD